MAECDIGPNSCVKTVARLRRGFDARRVLLSRLLKNSLAARFQDGVVAVVEGELDFDAAVVFEFG